MASWGPQQFETLDDWEGNGIDTVYPFLIGSGGQASDLAPNKPHGLAKAGENVIGEGSWSARGLVDTSQGAVYQDTGGNLATDPFYWPGVFKAVSSAGVHETPANTSGITLRIRCRFNPQKDQSGTNPEWDDPDGWIQSGFANNGDDNIELMLDVTQDYRPHGDTNFQTTPTTVNYDALPDVSRAHMNHSVVWPVRVRSDRSVNPNQGKFGGWSGSSAADFKILCESRVFKATDSNGITQYFLHLVWYPDKDEQQEEEVISSDYILLAAVHEPTGVSPANLESPFFSTDAGAPVVMTSHEVELTFVATLLGGCTLTVSRLSDGYTESISVIGQPPQFGGGQDGGIPVGIEYVDVGCSWASATSYGSLLSGLYPNEGPRQLLTWAMDEVSGEDQTSGIVGGGDTILNIGTMNFGGTPVNSTWRTQKLPHSGGGKWASIVDRAAMIAPDEASDGTIAEHYNFWAQQVDTLRTNRVDLYARQGEPPSLGALERDICGPDGSGSLHWTGELNSMLIEVDHGQTTDGVFVGALDNSSENLFPSPNFKNPDPTHFTKFGFALAGIANQGDMTCKIRFAIGNSGFTTDMNYPNDALLGGAAATHYMWWIRTPSFLLVSSTNTGVREQQFEMALFTDGDRPTDPGVGPGLGAPPKGIGIRFRPGGIGVIGELFVEGTTGSDTIHAIVGLEATDESYFTDIVVATHDIGTDVEVHVYSNGRKFFSDAAGTADHTVSKAEIDTITDATGGPEPTKGMGYSAAGEAIGQIPFMGPRYTPQSWGGSGTPWQGLFHRRVDRSQSDYADTDAISDKLYYDHDYTGPRPTNFSSVAYLRSTGLRCQWSTGSVVATARREPLVCFSLVEEQWDARGTFAAPFTEVDGINPIQGFFGFPTWDDHHAINGIKTEYRAAYRGVTFYGDGEDWVDASSLAGTPATGTGLTIDTPYIPKGVSLMVWGNPSDRWLGAEATDIKVQILCVDPSGTLVASSAIFPVTPPTNTAEGHHLRAELIELKLDSGGREFRANIYAQDPGASSKQSFNNVPIVSIEGTDAVTLTPGEWATFTSREVLLWRYFSHDGAPPTTKVQTTWFTGCQLLTSGTVSGGGGGGGQRDYSTVAGVAIGLQERSAIDVRGTMESVPYKRIVDVRGRVEGGVDDPQLGHRPIDRRLLVFEPDSEGRLPGSVGHTNGLGNTTANWYYVGVQLEQDGPIFWGAPATEYDDEDLTSHKLEPLQIAYESGASPTMTLEQRSIAHFGGHLRAGMHVVYLERVNGKPFEIEGNTGAVVGGGGIRVLFRGVVQSVSRISSEATVRYECVGMQGVVENATLLGMSDCGIGQIAFNVEPGSPNIPYAISRMLDYKNPSHGTPENFGSMFGLGTPDLTGMTLADIIEFLVNLFRDQLNEMGALRLRSDGKVTVANADGSTVSFHDDNELDDDDNTDDGYDEDTEVDLYLSYENGTGVFIPGNLVEGANSGAIGTVISNTTQVGTVGVLGLGGVVGQFKDDVAGEQINNNEGVTADIVIDSIGEVVAHQGPAETASIVWSPNRDSFNLRPVETVVKGSFAGIIRALLENQPSVRWRLEPDRLRWVFETRDSLKGVTIYTNTPGVAYDLADDATDVSTAALFASPWRQQTQFWASFKDGTIKPYWLNGSDAEWMSPFAQIGQLDGEVVEAHNWPYGPNAGPDEPQNTLITVKVNVGEEALSIGNFDKTTFKILEGQHAGFTSTVAQSQQQGGFTPPFQYFVFTVEPPVPGGWDTDVELAVGDLVRITDDPLEGTTNDSAAYNKIWADYILIEPGTGTPISNILPGGNFLANSPVGGCGGQYESGVQQNIPVNAAVHNGSVVTSPIPLTFGAFACSVDPAGTGHAVTCGGEIIYRAIRVQEGVWCARAPDVGYAGTAYQDVITHEGVVTKAHEDGLGFDDYLAHWPPGQWEPRGGSLAKLLIIGGHAVIFDTDDIEPGGTGTETDLNANVTTPFAGGWELANDWTESPAFAGTPQQTKPLFERTLDDAITDVAEWHKLASGSSWETSQGITWVDAFGTQGRARGSVLTRFIPSNYTGPQDFTIITEAGHFQTSSLNTHQEIEGTFTVDTTDSVTSLAQVGLIARAENGWVEQYRVPPNDEGAADPWFLDTDYTWTNGADVSVTKPAHLSSLAYRSQSYITHNDAAKSDSIPGWISSEGARNSFRESATPDTGGGAYDGLSVLGTDGRVFESRFLHQDPNDITTSYKTGTTAWPVAARELKSGLEFGTTGYVFRMVRGDEPDMLLYNTADSTSLWPTLFWYHTRRAVDGSGNQVYDVNDEPVFEGVKEVVMQWPSPIGVTQLDNGEDIRLKMSFDQSVNGGPTRIRCSIAGLLVTPGPLGGQWHNERNHESKFLLFDGTIETYGPIPFAGQYTNLYSGFSMTEGAHGFGCGIVKAVMTKASGDGLFESATKAAKCTRFTVRRINQPDFQFHEFQEELDAAFEDAQVGLVSRNDSNSIRYSLIDSVGLGSTPRAGDHYRLYMDRGWGVARMKTFEAEGLDDPAKVWIFKHMADSALKEAQNRKYAGTITVPGTRYDLTDGGIGLNLADTGGYTGLEDVRQPLAGVTYHFPAGEARTRQTVLTLETSFNPFSRIDALLEAQARSDSIFGGPAWASPDGRLNQLNQTKQGSAGLDYTGISGFGNGNVQQVCSSNVYIGGDNEYGGENKTLNEWIALFEVWLMQIKILIESNKEDPEQLASDGGGEGGGITTMAGFVGKDTLYDRIRARMRNEGRPEMDALVDPSLVYRDTDGLLYSPYLAATARGDGASFTWVPVVESATPGQYEVDTPNMGRKPREGGTSINRTLVDGSSASYVLTSPFREPVLSVVAGAGFTATTPAMSGAGEFPQLLLSTVGLSPVPDINNALSNNLINWATVEKNAGSFPVDLGTNPSRITALQTGPHNLTVNLTFANSATDYTGILKVKKNGIALSVRVRGGYVKGSGGSNSNGLSLVDLPIDLTAGDYLEVFIDRGSATGAPMWLQVAECYAKLEFKGLELTGATAPAEGDLIGPENVAGFKITYNPLDPFEVTLSANAVFGPATILLSS